MTDQVSCVVSRRQWLIRGAWGAAALAAGMPSRSRAQGDFPRGNFEVMIPTGAGGGAERIARVFTQVWRKALHNAAFEFEFQEGAGGLVGYRIYVERKPRDGYHLLFGNMGPETIGIALERPSFRFPEDFHYFCQVDVDDSVVFVRRDSRFRTIQQLVEEARRRPVTVAVSRIPHPVSIGLLALGEETGAKFNLVPYGGGRPTMVAVINGEVDCGGLPAANPIQLKDRVRVLGVFSDANPLGPMMENAPSINKVFGTRIPDLPSARAWAIHTSVRERYPERYQLLVQTARQVFSDPEFERLYRQTGAPWEAITYGDAEACTRYVQRVVQLTERYRDLLSGAKA
ncbi:MAG TPA: tripartite tricarboxylate transporter substrate-binding protein [Limnochordales bacterium]